MFLECHFLLWLSSGACRKLFVSGWSICVSRKTRENKPLWNTIDHMGSCQGSHYGKLGRQQSWESCIYKPSNVLCPGFCLPVCEKGCEEDISQLQRSASSESKTWMIRGRQMIQKFPRITLLGLSFLVSKGIRQVVVVESLD